MKRIYTFLILLAMSGGLFAQVSKNLTNNAFKAIKVEKQIDNSAKSATRAITDSIHYDGVNNSAIGTDDAANFGCYMLIPQDSLNANADMKISAVKIYMNDVAKITALQIRLYTDTSTTASYTQDLTIPISAGWNLINLTTPFDLPATGYVCLGYNVTVTGGFPAGCDEGPFTPNGNIIYMDGTWTHLNILAATLKGNWNIRAMIEPKIFNTPFPSCTPTAWNVGTVEINSTTTSANFTLKNIGIDTLKLTSATIENLAAPFTCTLDSAEITAKILKPDSTYTFTFTYSPTAVGTHNQNVVIKTNGGDVTIALKGVALAPEPIANCDITTWDADAIEINTNKISPIFTLKNTGFSNLICSAIEGISAPFGNSLVPSEVNLTHNATKTFTFSYDPTAEGTHNQTVTIKTNGGDITINLKGKAFDCSANIISTFPHIENFDTGVPNCWTALDADGDGYNWKAYEDLNYGKILISESSVENTDGNWNALTPNNYLITTILNEATKVEYKIGSLANTNYIAEHYAVCASSTGKNEADFSILFEETLDATAFSKKIGRTVNLPTGTKYVAFRHFNCSDKYILVLDSVVFNNTIVSIENANAANISIYPNPSTDNFTIFNAANSNVSVYDVLGNNIANYRNISNNAVINTREFAEGTYIIKIDNGVSVSTKKIIVVR